MLMRADSSADDESSTRSSGSSTDSWRQKVALSRGDRSPMRGGISPARAGGSPGRDAVTLVMGAVGSEAGRGGTHVVTRGTGAQAQRDCSACESVDDMNVAQLKARAMKVRREGVGGGYNIYLGCVHLSA